MTRIAILRALVVALVAMGATACPDLTPPIPDDPFDSDASRNRAPVLAPLGTEIFREGDAIRIVLTVYDPDGDPVTISAGPLPQGATFDAARGVFEWVPPLGASVASPYELEFRASDGEFESLSFGTLVIEPAIFAIRDVYPGRISQSGGERLTLTGIGFATVTGVRIGGVAATEVEAVSDVTVRVTAPALPEEFGPQPVLVTAADGRTTQAPGAVFVFRDARDLRLAVRTVVRPGGSRLLGAADLDGRGGASFLVGGEAGLTAIDPAGADPPTPLSEDPVAAATGADIDGDGDDEVIATFTDGAVDVWRSATSAPIALHRGSAAAAVTTLDFDGDGDLEVVVVDQDGARWLYPWLTSDGGRFGEVIPSPGTAVPTHLEALDFDANGVTDLLFETDDGFGVAFGVETGTFLPVEMVPGSSGLAGAVPEWREGVGWEIAGIDADSEQVRYFRRDPEGLWRVAREHSFVPRDGRLTLIDLVGDTTLELLTSETGLSGLRVDGLTGDQLADTSWLMLGPVEGEPMLVDLDGDAIDDLALASEGRDAIEWVARHRVDELPDAPLGLYSDQGRGLLVADYTRDGFVDVVVTGTALADIPVHLLFQLDVPGLRGSVSIALPLSGSPESVVLGDLSGNHWTDILSIDEAGDVTCIPAFNASTFGPTVANQFARPAVQLAGVRRFGGAMTAAVRFDDGGVVLARANERCILSLVERLDVSAAQIDSGDLDGDGRDEIFVQTTDGALEIWSSPIGTRYSRQARLELALETPRALAHGDVDGDGRGDLVLAGSDGVEVVEQPLFARSGTLTTTLLDTAAASGVAAGDLNGDGRAEIVVTGGGVAPRVYWVDDESLRVQVLPDWHAEARSPFLADVDRDADLDIITLQPGFGAVIWPNGAAP